MKLRSALVTIEFLGSKPAKTRRAARLRAPDARTHRSAKPATAIAYPYVAEPPRKPAPASNWPFAPKKPPTPPNPERLAQEPAAPEPVRDPADSQVQALKVEPESEAATKAPAHAAPGQPPPPAGHTEPPLAPQSAAPDASTS